MPCSNASAGASYAVEGFAWSDDGYVMIARYLTGGWDYECAALLSDGSFTTTVSWTAAETGGATYLMIAAAESDCSSYQGWDASAWIVVD